MEPVQPPMTRLTETFAFFARETTGAMRLSAPPKLTSYVGVLSATNQSCAASERAGADEWLDTRCE